MAVPSNEVRLRKDLYWYFVGIPAAILLVLLVIGTLIGVWWLVVVLGLLYVVASLQVLKAHEIGGIIGFGYLLKIANVGLNFVPLGLGQMIKVPRPPHQKQFPEEPDLVFQGHDTEELPVRPDGRQMVRPIRIITGRPLKAPTTEAQESETETEGLRAGLKKYYDGPLNIQITVKMTGSVRYFVIPDKFFQFWTQFPGDTAEEKFEDIDRQLQDTFVDVCKREWQKRPYGMIIDDDKVIENNIKKELQEEVKDWAICVMEVNLFPPDAGQHLNEELSRIGQELAKKQQTIAKADGDLYAQQKEAEAKLARENADTDAAHYRSEKLGMSGREVIGLEAAFDMLHDKDKFFFGADGIAQAVASGTTILDALKASGGNPKSDESKVGGAK